MKKLVLGLAMLGALTGCSVFESDDENAAADLVDFNPTVNIDKNWTFKIGEQHKYLSPMRLSEDLGVIYAANTEGRVVALDSQSGETTWEVDLGVDISGGVSAHRGLLALGTSTGSVYALNTSDGSVKWSAQTATEILAAPINAGRVVVLHGSDGVVTGFDSGDGTQLWQYKEGLPALTMQGVSEPVVDAGLAVVGFASGKLSVIKIDQGLPLWESLVAVPSGKSDLERIVDIDGKPVIAGSSVIAATLNGSIKAFDIRSGRVSWEADASTSQSLATGFGNVYMAEISGILNAYRIDTGAQAWRNDQMRNRGLSAPVVWSSYLAVGDREGYVHVISQIDGSFVARYDVGSPIRSLMSSRGKDLYVLDDSGRITALTLAE